MAHFLMLAAAGITVRKVEASRGWRWIAEGIALFRKNPGQWLFLTAILFFCSRILYAIPVVGIVALLVVPNILAGLCHGAQALEQGKPLRVGYLASGFLKNAAHLITIGGVSLVGKFVGMIVVTAMGGEAITEIAKTMAAGAVTQETMDAVRIGRPALMNAFVAGLAISLPFLMATWFAPLLVFFVDVPPRRALGLSLLACVRNVLPFLVYGAAVLAPMMILMPLGMAARQPDLAIWLLAPVVVPSIYASYKDLFVQAPDSGGDQQPTS
jgi:hypothetical protein